MTEALGELCCEVRQPESACWACRRSLSVVQDVRVGDVFTAESLRSIRPAHELYIRYQDQVLGRRVAVDIPKENAAALGTDGSHGTVMYECTMTRSGVVGSTLANGHRPQLSAVGSTRHIFRADVV